MTSLAFENTFTMSNAGEQFLGNRLPTDVLLLVKSFCADPVVEKQKKLKRKLCYIFKNADTSQAIRQRQKEGIIPHHDDCYDYWNDKYGLYGLVTEMVFGLSRRKVRCMNRLAPHMRRRTSQMKERLFRIPICIKCGNYSTKITRFNRLYRKKTSRRFSTISYGYDAEGEFVIYTPEPDNETYKNRLCCDDKCEWPIEVW